VKIDIAAETRRHLLRRRASKYMEENVLLYYKYDVHKVIRMVAVRGLVMTLMILEIL